LGSLSRFLVNYPSFSDEVVKPDVVRIRGNGVEYLKVHGDADRDRCAGALSESSIIKSASVAEPRSIVPECEPWAEKEVYF